MAELLTLGQHLRSRTARRDTRRLQRSRPARPRLREGPVRERRTDGHRRRDRQHVCPLAGVAIPDLAPIGTGSHIDAIPNAGLYDGCVGVLGGLEAIRVLQELGFKPRRSIELVIFTAEEPTRFGIGCLGSRMMGAVLTPEQALALRDKEGRGLEELRAAAGFTGSLESVALHPRPLPPIRRAAHRAGSAARTGRHRRRPRDAHRRARKPADLIEGEGGHAGAS